MAFRYKFDDERVTKEDMKRALEEQYGGEEEVVFVHFLLFIFVIQCYMLLLAYEVIYFPAYDLTVTTNKSWIQQHAF